VPRSRTRLERNCEAWAAAVGWAAAAVGAAVLVGWAVDIPIPESFTPAWVGMKPNTALGFIFSGAGLALLARADAGVLRRRAGLAFAVLAALMGLLNVLEYGFGWDLRIDQLLFEDHIAIATGRPFPGRMSPITAVNFTVYGTALMLFHSRAGHRAAEILTIVMLLPSYLALLGYVYEVRVLYAPFTYTSVALNTAVAFLGLGAGLLLSRPYRGLMSLITSDHAGGLLARRLLPFAVAVPIVVGWLRLEGQRLGWYNTEFGIALLVGVNTTIFAAVILWNVRSLDAADRERQQAEVVRKLNAELDQRVAALDAANKDLEAFSYSVAHDLRSPLTSIQGFTDIVLDEHSGSLSAEARQMLQAVNRNARRMGLLIGELLAFARLGRQAMKRENVQLGALVRQTIGDMEENISGRAINFDVGELGMVEGDATLLKQVFINLVGNAVKFTRERNPAEIAIGCATGADGTRVYYVKDNGAGFDPRYAAKLFGVFQRLHRAEDFEGTGIGLAIVQRVVERHGGRVWAESTPGAGATFYFTLGETPEAAAA
jgi:signal transduction histidine kinase